MAIIPVLTHGEFPLDLTEVFKKVLNEQEFGELEASEKPVKAMIFAEATRIAELPDIGADLEKKVVLSISIRLAAEEFAIAKIDDVDWVASLSSNQTAQLINRYKDKFSDIEDERSNIRLLEQVNLMTPENIHLNSFMFEPILDMSAEHLAKLHTEIMCLEL